MEIFLNLFGKTVYEQINNDVTTDTCLNDNNVNIVNNKKILNDINVNYKKDNINIDTIVDIIDNSYPNSNNGPINNNGNNINNVNNNMDNNMDNNMNNNMNNNSNNMNNDENTDNNTNHGDKIKYLEDEKKMKIGEIDQNLEEYLVVKDKTRMDDYMDITKIKGEEIKVEGTKIEDEKDDENIKITYTTQNFQKENKVFRIEENYFEHKDQSELEKKYQDLNIKYQTLERKLNENTDIIKKYSIMEDKINLFMSIFEKENYAKLLETVMRLNDRISKIENDIFDIFDLIGDFDDQFQQLFTSLLHKKEIRSLKSQIENIILELSSLKTSLSENKNQITSHNTIINGHTSLINTLHYNFDHLNSDISSELSSDSDSSFKSTILLLNSQIKQLKQELSDIRYVLSSKSNINQSDFIRSFNLALRSRSAVPFVPQHTSVYPFDSSQNSSINKTNTSN